MSNMTTLPTLSLAEFCNLVEVIGRETTVIGEGEPGIGKSAMLKELASRPQFKDYVPVYMDAALLDLGDLQMPIPQEVMVKFLPNELIYAQGNGVPVILMIDELGKALRPVINGLLPLLLEKRIGTFVLHPDSLIFGTTNLSSDGVGDKLEAHARNRVCFVQVAKPTSDEWVEWGQDAGIAPDLLAWAKENPHAFASYTDPSQADNAYIFNPKKSQRAFVSPRSLAKASPAVINRHRVTRNTLIAALCGTLGEAAARDLEVYLDMGDKLPEWDRVVGHPETAPLPDNAIGQSIMVFKAVQRLERADVDAWMKYLGRMQPEHQAMFAYQAMKSGKAGMFGSNRAFTDMCRKNAWVFA